MTRANGNHRIPITAVVENPRGSGVHGELVTKTESIYRRSIYNRTGRYFRWLDRPLISTKNRGHTRLRVASVAPLLAQRAASRAQLDIAAPLLYCNSRNKKNFFFSVAVVGEKREFMLRMRRSRMENLGDLVLFPSYYRLQPNGIAASADENAVRRIFGLEA